MNQEKEYMSSPYIFPVTVTSVYDADTFRGDIDLGFRHQFNNQAFRLHGIDAWEVSLRGDTTLEEKAKGIIARDKLREIMPVGSRVMVEVNEQGTGKYGRHLVDLWVPVPTGFLNEGSAWVYPTKEYDGVEYLHVNSWLITEGHAIEADY